MSYKVIYHIGDAIGWRTTVATGSLFLDGSRLLIQGEQDVEIPVSSLRSVELFRLHGTGRMLTIVHTGGTLFVSVIRSCLFGCFAVISFFATGRLRNELASALCVQDNSHEG